MALTLGDNFSYQGAKPLDARLNYSTVAAMKAVADATMYNGCMAYCTETDKTYQWKSANTVDETLGKWREFTSGGGGGGGSSYTAGDGIDITGDVISTEKSEEGAIDEIIDRYPTAGELVSIVNAFNKGDLYSTTERMIGQWIDGRPLYQKTITTTTPRSGDSDVCIHVFDSDVERIVDVTGYGVDETIASKKGSLPLNIFYNTTVYIAVFAGDSPSDSSKRALYCRCGSWLNMGLVVTAKYIKSTDQAVSIGEANEYSTTEKIIGTWVDGKPIYQRTYDLVTDLVVGYDSTWTMTSIDSTGIDKVIDCLATNSTGTFFPMMAYADGTQHVIGLTACRYGRTATVRHLTLQYTKTT